MVSWQIWSTPKNMKAGRADDSVTQAVTEHGTPYRAPRPGFIAVLEPSPRAAR